MLVVYQSPSHISSVKYTGFELLPGVLIGLVPFCWKPLDSIGNAAAERMEWSQQ